MFTTKTCTICGDEFNHHTGDPLECSLACQIRADEDLLDAVEALKCEFRTAKASDFMAAFEGLLDDLAVK